MAKEPYNVSVLVTDSQGKDVFIFESNSFDENEVESLKCFLLPDMLEEPEIKDFPNED